ncbi:MAG: recombinase family protein [Clostridium sp.]|nr:recombinase family protein [Bacteroides sp.]MCM1197464.1 recombinase family protein [Clostridium sp.]
MIYAYIRVSTEMQTYSSQEFEIMNYCRRSNIAIDKWITESVSGTVAVEKRTLGKTIEKMKKGDLLICTEISRLGRNMLMVMSILNLCSSKGIAIHTIKDHFDLSENINSKIIAFAFALAAEIERSLISQRTKEALSVKKTAGIKLGRPSGSSSKKVTVCNEMDKILKMIDENIPMDKIAHEFGIHRNTLRRYLKNYKNE